MEAVAMLAAYQYAHQARYLSASRLLLHIHTEPPCIHYLPSSLNSPYQHSTG